jgi:hypothetical protein
MANRGGGETVQRRGDVEDVRKRGERVDRLDALEGDNKRFYEGGAELHILAVNLSIRPRGGGGWAHRRSNLQPQLRPQQRRGGSRGTPPGRWRQRRARRGCGGGGGLGLLYF